MWTNIARQPYQRGFSLLEILVALSILSMSLGALYQATSGATRNVRNDERYVFGVELARSLLVEYGQVPSEGGSWAGETDGGFFWKVNAAPVELPLEILLPGTIQSIDIEVGWNDGLRERKFELSSVVEGLPTLRSQDEIIP